MQLARRDWVPEACEAYVQRIAGEMSEAGSEAVAARIEALIGRNAAIHDRDCINLNPATNVMNPKAEAALAAGLGSRPSRGSGRGRRWAIRATNTRWGSRRSSRSR